MNQKLIAVLGVSLTLAPFAAQAHGRHWHHDDDDDRDEVVRVAPPPAQPGGHYEWRGVNRWVAGRGEQVFVPGSCAVRPWFHRVVCRPGYYGQRWIPGHYEQGGQWVWVPDPVQTYPQYQEPAPSYPEEDEPAPSGPVEPAPAPSEFQLNAGPGGVSVGVRLTADVR